MEKKTSYKKEIKEDIIEIASHLFSEYTYMGASMSDIAKKLNIAKAALYYYYKSKAFLDKEIDSKKYQITLLLFYFKEKFNYVYQFYYYIIRLNRKENYD